MLIRHAELEDLDSISQIYERARAFMQSHGNPSQWGNNWPPQDLITRDIKSNRLYVSEDNKKVVAVFFFDFGYRIESTYNEIEGQWLGDDYYGVVHRIASSARGAAGFCLKWCFEQYPHLRIDTHADNLPMQGLIKKLGFSYCGVIRLSKDNSTRLAYEKL